MRSEPHFRVLGFSLIALLVAGCATVRAYSDDEIRNPAPATLALGTVVLLGSAPCLTGAAKGASCTSVRVSCPGLPDLDATLGEASPKAAAKGTIVLHNGGDGTAFFASGFPNTYVNDGFRVVQIGWASDWEITGGLGLKSASCRPSTLFKYIFDTVHKDSLTTGFCAQGISGGGATIAYSLAQYGLSNYFDYVVIGAGPGVARMDYGCDKSLYTGAPRNLCSLLTNAPYAYPAGTKENNWEDTTTCAAKSPLPNDISRWTADSIVTSGATYSYPKTGLSFYFCVTPPAAQSAGQGSFFTTQVIPKNNPADVNCYSGVCKGESVWQDKSAFNTTVAEMLAQCVPNHKKSTP